MKFTSKKYEQGEQGNSEKRIEINSKLGNQRHLWSAANKTCRQREQMKKG